ncbi:hypothetical protein EIB75_10770 [Epilithonimonas vandammei]|uniref:Phage protein n=1 Tax=Epilithonimonas vandammei TaxID=2487072 RepID=A0A3G8ZFV0_9FLAO|nr:hypothetical protein [Epilithonimonas vandammei]AZI53877.1 hypothetical protein EIB75_00785 [Epilithonimonas vandammei]AZI55705.1 hypothetical protein EIB75_10770 [Epilithonimonas vandammei]
MARNKLSDLNDHLFAQMERLSDENLSPEELEQELKRSKAIEGVSKQILGNSKLVLEAAKFKVKATEAGEEFTNPKLLE